jgi:GNAT superfamily N-acetyltransferase
MQADSADIEVRMARPSDAEAIATVLLDSFEEYRVAYTEGGFAATTPTSDRIAARMSEGPVWLALRGQTVIGTVSAVPRKGSLYIRSMAVVPEARGRDVGGLLLMCVESFAWAHGYRRMFLSTTPFLTRAIRLYERWGFTRSGERRHELFGTPLFTMVKDLDPRELEE